MTTPAPDFDYTITLASEPPDPLAWLHNVDAEERETLRALGVTLAHAEDIDTGRSAAETEAVRDAYVSSVLFAILRTRRALARLATARSAEHRHVDMRYDFKIAPLQTRERQLGALVAREAMRADFGGSAARPKKSRRVAFGTYGRKLKQRAVAIVDAAKLLLWATTNARDVLRVDLVGLPLPAFEMVRDALLGEILRRRAAIEYGSEYGGDEAARQTATESVVAFADAVRAFEQAAVTSVSKSALNAWVDRDSQGEEPDGVTVTAAVDEPTWKVDDEAPDVDAHGIDADD